MKVRHLAAAGWLAALAATAAAQHSPYAGQQQRAIKALSVQEVADIEAGKGMGFAKTAELNGYPGPAHVLELKEQLALSPEQLEPTQRLMTDHKARAKAIGERLLAAESALDAAFAMRHIDERRLNELTMEIGRQQAALREEHLRTHLAQTALLNGTQIKRYAELRGYTDSTPAASPNKHH
jgi:hypothetical protein